MMHVSTYFGLIEPKQAMPIAVDCNNSIDQHTQQQQFKPSTQILMEIVAEFQYDVMCKG